MEVDDEGIWRPSPRHWNRGKTHCIRGHEFTERNTIRRSDGTRVCRECHNARRRKPKED